MKQGGGNKLAAVCSWISLAISIAALVLVCRNCCPELGGELRRVLGGLEDSPVRQAFSVMADGLGSGAPVKDTMRDTAQVLFGSAD